MPGQPELRHGPRRGRDDAAWPVVLSAVLLAGAVAAAVSAAMLRLGPAPEPGYGPNDSVRIASVRLGEMTAAYAVKAAGAGSSAETAIADARRWGAALEIALARVAERQRAVLLPARAVAAGAPDVTAEVEAVLAALLGQRTAGRTGGKTGSPPGDGR